MAQQDIDFGFVITAVGAPGASDAEMYREIFNDVEHGIELGYSTAWMIEHHFSDYFPTANPLQLLAFIAGRYPEIALGTCVLVLPWYQPLRLAEDIAQLRLLTDKPIHLGVGRGTAILEFERFGIPNMDETRDRFRETLEIVRTALHEDTITYEGKYLSVPQPTRLRPKVDPQGIHFYGACGASPESGNIMADLGLPVMCTSIGDLEKQKATVNGWRDRARANGVDVDNCMLPIMVNCIIADTDEEAIEEAKTYIPRFMQAQVDHYEAEDNHLRLLESYGAWGKVFEAWKARCDPENIPPWCRWQLVGSPDTVRQRTQEFIDAGFNHIFLQTATPGVPEEPRRRWMKRFAEEVAPQFCQRFSKAA